MSNENTNTTPTAPINTDEIINVNGIPVTLKRTETERVKKGETATVYYAIPLVQFNVMVPKLDDKGQPKLNDDKTPIMVRDDNATLARFATLLSFEQLADKLQAKLNQDCRGAQMDAGKDTYDMPTKLANLKTYIEGGFGASRANRKSPLDLAKEEFENTVKLLKVKLEAKTIDAATFRAEAMAAQQTMMAKILAATVSIDIPTV